MGSKKVLKKQPIVYVLVSVQTTDIPKLGSYIDDIHAELINLGFVEKIESSSHELKINLQDLEDEEGHSFIPETSKKDYRWDFLSLKRDMGVVLTKNQICLKKTSYDGFDKMLESFDQIFSAIGKTINGFEQFGVKRIGLRYIDVFVPFPGDSALDYLQNKYHVNLFENQPEFKAIEELVNIESLSKTEHGMLRHRIIENRPVNGRAPILPPDIDEPAQVALRPIVQEHWKQLTDQKYIMLDIDHFSLPEMKLSKSTVLEKIRDLYQISSDVFWASLSEKGLEKFELSEIEVNPL